MPQIFVTADGLADDGAPAIMFRERVSVDDFESEHFAAQFIERLRWAVGDADEVGRRSRFEAERRRARRRRMDMAERELLKERRETSATAPATPVG
jgi:hypothetical protein